MDKSIKTIGLNCLITLMIVFFVQTVLAQSSSPPIISYITPQTFVAETTISPLYITNTGNPATTNGETFSFAGSGSAGSTNGTGAAASFNQPIGMTVDASGNVYISDVGNEVIRKITPSGVVSTFAGTGTIGSTNGTGTAAAFYHPVGMCVDALGNIYVADEDNHMIRKMTPAGVVTTLAGSTTPGSANGTGTGASFNLPCGVAADAAGNVYVADYNNNQIRKITSAGVVTTFAGNATAGSANGTGTGASFNHPFSIAIDPSGNLYVADRLNFMIRKITPGGVVTTLAGSTTAGFLNGTGTTAEFNYPTTVTTDASGNVYVADESNNRIRKITSAGVVTTLAGTGAQGANNAVGNNTTFYNPFAVAFDPSGYIYVCDYSNNLIRKVSCTPFNIIPQLPAGLNFNTADATITGTPTVASVTTPYYISAHSNYGGGNTTLTITVNPAGSINLSRDQNFIATFNPRVSGLTNNSQLMASVNDKTQVQVDVTYLDGLGRALQAVQAKASPLGADIVQPVAYDVYSREAVKYLPYTSTTNDGTYKSDALIANAGVSNFYNPTGSSGTQLSNGIARITFPFAETAFELSPLNRPIEQGAAGDNWQLANKVGPSNPGHTVKNLYTSNNNIFWSIDTIRSMQVALYRASINTDQSRTLTRANNNTAVYDTAQLFVTIVKDQNWTNGKGGTIEEYHDKNGNIILKRTYSFTTSLQVLSTYYVYDDLENLVFVLPPGAAPDATTAINQTTLDNLCYQYRYDERNRLSQRKIPGKGWEYTIYNTLDQTVASQDSVQRAQKNWVFTKYDAFGRIASTGIWNNNNSAISRSALQSQVNGLSSNLWEAPISTGNGYNGVAWPTSSITATLSLNYYDTYANIPGLPSNYYLTSGVSQMTRGISTAKRTAVLNTPTDMLWDVIYYDDLGRTIKSYTQHYLGGTANTGNFDLTTSTYNFTNLPTTVTRQHWNTLSNTVPLVTMANRYIYDHRGRRVKSWTQITNGNLSPDTKTLISQVDYNEIGQMLTKHLHSVDSVTFLQNIAYAYNERGWLLSSTAPLFSLQLQYNTGATKAYNGNIMSQSWTSNASNGSFTYTYDVLNRLTSGKSGDNKYIERGITYDPLGNINALSRVYNNVLVDSLSYNYLASTNPTNQLQNVNDKSSDASTIGYKANNWTYAYDGNGNMIADNSKGISLITYNLLNQPQAIAAKNTTYTYDATGKKLRRVISTAATDYVYGIQYEGGAMSFIQTEEGRAIPNGNTNYNYEYNLTDHLGDSRLTFDSASGTARTEQQDNYMPFGMDISVGTIGSPQNTYLYNKKELQTNTQTYDYGARFYDPVIGRWGHIDPKAELYFQFSPYVYAANTPVNAIDPNGHLVIFVNGNYFSGGGTSGYWRTEYNSTRRTASGNGTVPHTYGIAFDKRIMNELDDQHARYVDGGGNVIKGYHPFLSLLFPGLSGVGAADRQGAGYRQGSDEAAAVIESLHRTGGVIDESIKVITHSMGGAYGKGYIQAILDYAKANGIKIKVDFEADFAPFQTGQQKAVKGVKTYQYSHDESVAGNDPIQGETQMDTSKDDQSHSIFSFLDDIKNLPAGKYKVVNGKIVPDTSN
ncbi:MAG TPA: hypothetical protein DCO83_09420 [Mucilaginibacter sp.]|jgi:RHS repeat-associated protein|nr:hypothetical protein [Mucilaginibacter sp.]